MQRKLVRQGKTALTVTLPKKWTNFNNLEAGNLVEINEEENKLILCSQESKKTKKSISIELSSGKSNEFRSIIGGLYRGGYDEIKVRYNDPNIIQELQKTVNSLFGFEIFDIDPKRCTIRSVFREESSNIDSHFRRMLHGVKVMQNQIIKDMTEKKYNSKELILQYRNNILKQRDIIARIIVQEKLLDSKHFPYYLLAFNVWSVSRNYYFMYLHWVEAEKISNKSQNYLEETNKFFDNFFTKRKSTSLERHQDYTKRLNFGSELMRNKKEANLFVSYCMNIIQLTQACNSHLLLLDL
tara:strand:+ start:2798 stop:3688 length:891 start_codon:yes stop_codon:yes gene_type:complete